MEEQNHLRALVSTRATGELKKLLEEKHLYQKFKLDPAPEAAKLSNRLANPHIKVKYLAWAADEFPKEKFSVFIHQAQLVPRAGSATQPASSLWITLPHPSLYCNSKGCKRRETFTPVWHTELSDSLTTTITPKQITLPGGFQMFTLVYQCQRCLGTPEAFLVRREQWTFSLEGRSPLERVEVPKFIPDKEEDYYSNAIVAFNSGKVLAGLFYLRTFVEQFARRVTEKTGRATGEEIMDAYYETLPAKTKDLMPSLREWYEKLSIPIHSGTDDIEVFSAALAAIDKHFEIRKVFNMSDTPPQLAKEVSPTEEAPPQNA
jgi:hypothetical protein